jgi:hypothetical protein
MSHENVEIAKRGRDPYNRRDVDTFAELATTDFACFPSTVGIIEGESYRGREGIEKSSRTSETPGRNSVCSVTSFAISVTA